MFHISGNKFDGFQFHRWRQLKENEVAILRHQTPEEGLAPVGFGDAVLLIVLDVRLGLGWWVLVGREQSHFAELKKIG